MSLPVHDQRIRYVRMLVTSELADQVRMIWVPPDRWDLSSFVVGAGDHHAMGFGPPWPGAGTKMTAAGCAEVLVMRTANLDDEAFYGFVASVVAHLRLHLVAQVGDGTVAPKTPNEVEAEVLAVQRDLPLDFGTYESIAGLAA